MLSLCTPIQSVSCTNLGREKHSYKKSVVSAVNQGTNADEQVRYCWANSPTGVSRLHATVYCLRNLSLKSPKNLAFGKNSSLEETNS